MVRCGIRASACSLGGNRSPSLVSIQLLVRKTRERLGNMFTRAMLGTMAVLATAAWAGRGATAVTDPISDPAATLAEVNLGLALSMLCSSCVEGCDGTPKSHQLQTPSPKGGYDGHSEKKCYPQQCEVHDACGKGGTTMASAVSLERLVVNKGLKTATPAELLQLADRNPQRVRINRHRRALQLIGCESQVVASYTVVSVPALASLLD